MRSTIRPDLDLVVDEAAYTDLHRQGLLLPGHDGTTEYSGFIPTAAWPPASTKE